MLMLVAIRQCRLSSEQLFGLWKFARTVHAGVVHGALLSQPAVYRNIQVLPCYLHGCSSVLISQRCKRHSVSCILSVTFALSQLKQRFALLDHACSQTIGT